MGINCPPGAICSDPFQERVGANQTVIYGFTSTKVTQGSDGKVNGGTTTLNYSPSPGNYIPAATTTDGGKTWTYLKDSEGKEILGADAKKSLEQGALKSTLNKTVIPSAAKKAGIPDQQAKNLQLNNNTANPSGAPTADSTGATPLTKVEDLQAAVGKSKKSRDKFPKNLRYPLTLDTSKQDKIKFDMVEYRPAEFSSAASKQFGFNRASERASTTIGTVFLPIPSGISDTTGCNWGGKDANAADIAKANIAMGAITEGGGGAAKAIESVLTTAQGDSKGVGAAVATAIAGDVSGMGGGLLTRVTGAILNPNLELLFDSPTLRTFSFTFKMSARSEEEAKQIIGILRFFKQGMAPRKSDSNLFLLSPHTFKITYIHKNQEGSHKFLNKFKECALTNLTTNYTPEGQYATFYDGPMVSYEIQMQFQELEPVFNEDYGPGTGSGGPDTEIGF